MSKKSIGIDLDQVLNNLNKKWVDFYNEAYNDNLTLADIKTWGIDEYTKPECGKDIFKFLAIPGFFRDLEIQPNAQEVVKWLQENYEVYILSASHYAVTGDKGAWLQEYFPSIHYQNIIFCHNKSLVHLDYLIDDYGKNLETFTGQGLLFDSHHNQSENRFPRAKGWLEVKEYFKKELGLNNMKSKDNITYFIECEDDVSATFSKIIRYRLTVIVHGTPTKEELKQITKEITERYIKTHKFNALIFHFKDNKNFVYDNHSQLTLGDAVFAHKGKVSEAMNVHIGDYKNMEYNFNGLKEKDWTKQLSEHQINIWGQCTDLWWKNYESLEKEYDNYVHRYERNICKIIAVKNGLTQQEVEEIWDKLNAWTANDLSQRL